MTWADILNIAGGAFALASAAFYVPGILRGHVHPHMFTWLIWSLVLAIGSAAQVAGGAGWGALSTGCSAFVCILITFLSIKYGEKDIRPFDWVALAGALCAIPVWLVTSDPLGAILIVTLIDSLGYAPTLRKTWSKPWDEAVMIYAVSGTAYCLSLIAMGQWTWVTAFYPAVLVAWDFGLVGIALYRRRHIPRPF